MPTTAPRRPSPRRPPPIADRRLWIAAAALLAALALGPVPAAAAAKPKLMLMTGLPIVWGEAGPFDPASRPAAAYLALREEFDVELVDTIDGAAPLDRLLLLAQPPRLAPEELVALDDWVRRGGRALIFADPMLAWPSALPLGDIRRPPPVHLLGPLLGHWGLRLEPYETPERREERAGDLRLVMEAPGRFAAAPPACRVGPDWLARCRIGRGRAVLVADADLFRDDLWIPDGRREADNPAVVAGWLDVLAGVERERRPAPAREVVRRGWIAAAAAGLLLIAAGIALRRRRGGA